MNDKELNEFIRGASPPPDFPATFQREVWQRIAAAESRLPRSRLARAIGDWLQWMAGPAGAVATIMTMLLVGAGLGGMVSAKERDVHLKAAYAASINPILSAQTSEK